MEHQKTIETAQVIVQAVLAIAMTTGVFTIILLLMNQAIPADNERVFDTLIGSVVTAWLLTLGYHFGTSFGSEVKTKIMERVMKNGSGTPHA